MEKWIRCVYFIQDGSPTKAEISSQEKKRFRSAHDLVQPLPQHATHLHGDKVLRVTAERRCLGGHEDFALR